MDDEILGGVKTEIKQTVSDPVDPRYYIQSQNNYIDVKSLNVYDFMMHSYNGSDGYISGYYLTPFMKESFYEDRCRSAVYQNLFKPIIDAMVLPVFEKEVERITNDDVFELLLENCDNAGTPLTDFTEVVMTHARVCGISFVIVDNHANYETKTVKETISDRLFPYVYEKLPSEVHLIEVDKYGQPTRYVFYEGSIKVEKKTYQLYREWTNLSTTLYYEKGTVKVIVESREHFLGQIPVIPVNNFLKSKKVELQQPIYYNLAMLNFALYNKETYIQELEKNQCFSILVTQGMDPKMIVIGPTNYMNVPIDAPNLPDYISPNVDNTRVLVENCDRIKEEIYKEAGQIGVYAVKEQQSGIAKQWDFRSEERVLKKTSKAAADFEQRVAELFGLYINKSVTLESKYPQDFSPQYYDERIVKLLEIIKEMPPATLSEALWEEIAEIVYKQTPDKADEIIAKMQEDVNVQKELNGEKEPDE